MAFRTHMHMHMLMLMLMELMEVAADQQLAP